MTKTVPALCLVVAIAAFAGAADDKAWAPPPNIHGQSAWIPLHHQQQENNLCVPTSASIVLDHFGDTFTPREIKAWSRGREYKAGDAFDDFSITPFRDLNDGLARRGYRWKEHTYATDRAGFEKGLAEIEAQLDRGMPVMVDTTLRRGHTMVVAGYSKPDGKVYFIDPASPPPGVLAVGWDGFEAIWNSRAVGTDLRCMVIPRPKR